MSSADDHETPAAKHPAKNKPKGDYPVGYCKPPVEHRFRPGNNANPKGRGKGSKSRKLVIQEVLFEPITVREGNEIKQMPVLEAIVKKTATKALAGDNKAALTIIALAQKEGLLTREQEQAVENLSESDAAIMDDVKRRLGVGKSEHPGEGSVPLRTPSAPEPPPTDATQPATALPEITRPVLRRRGPTANG
jgi:hypothetical protein